MAEVFLSVIIVLSVIFLIVFLVFKSDNAIVICNEFSQLIGNDYVIQIKIRKKRRGKLADRDDRR